MCGICIFQLSFYFYVRRRLASGEGIVTLAITLCVRPPSRLYHVSTARRISLGGEGNALYPVLSIYLRRRLASGEAIVKLGLTLGVTLLRCVCVRRISLGGEGNALYPVLILPSPPLSERRRIVTLGVTLGVTLLRCVCVRRISLGCEGNALHPVHSNSQFYFN